MQNTSAKDLLLKYSAGLCTEEEEAMIESWYLQLPSVDLRISAVQLNASLDRIEERLPVNPKKRKSKLFWYQIAASVIGIVFLSVVGYIYTHKTITQKPDLLTARPVKPVSKAILTLAGGRKINLDRASAGQLAVQGNVIISNDGNGQVQYQPETVPNKNSNSQLNNITTKRGGQYQLTLSDGTKVWLNAASSITYPVTFSGDSRQVTISGEVYFEVAKNKLKPFLVRSGGQTVRVLGTHFNINNYLDDAPFIKTTLLEGSVEVVNNGQSAIIKPGEQALVPASGDNNNISIVSADTEEIMAWRTGDLVFENQDVRGVLKKVSRLYDVDVDFTDNLPDEKFNGVLSHAQNISEVLLTLQKTYGVHFKVEGRRVVVMP